MMNEVDFENLTIKQYLMLTQEKQTQGMIRIESEVSSDEDVDEWLNEELSKRITGHDKEKEEDALIDILKTVVEECKSIYKKAQIRTPSSRTSEIQGVSIIAEKEEGDSSETLPYQQPSNDINPVSFTLPCTIGNIKIYVMADVGAGINMIPKSLFEHLKLANLKKTSMVIEMGNMTRRAPLGIVENISVKINKFLFHSDFVVIDTLEEPDETILLGRPFFATIHAQIDVFRGEISLAVGNGKESEYFNEIENNDFLALEQRTFYYSEESVDTVDSSSDSQENEVGIHLYENVSRWYVCKPIHITFKVCEEDCGIWPTCNLDLSFCSGYDAIYGKEENEMLKQWICFRDHKRQNVRGNGIKFDDFLKVSPPNDTLRINTYFPDVSKTQPKESHIRKNSFEEWMKIKLGHTNISDSIRSMMFKEWEDEDVNFGGGRDMRWKKYGKNVKNFMIQPNRGFLYEEIGIRGLLDSYSCGSKVLSWRNHLDAPEVWAAEVASPARVLKLDTHSSSEADPLESSPPPVSIAPTVSPFLCSDDSESDTEIPERHVSPTTSTPETPTTPILLAPYAIVTPPSEFPLAPVALTVRKSVRHLLSHRLALRYTSHHLDHFTFGSSSSHSSTDHSLSRHSSSDHSLFGHTPLDTTNADSSTPQRFVHPPLASTPRCSEAYICWRYASLSTMYPPTITESSAWDSSSESSVGPSRKRCRSPAATVTSRIDFARALVPSRVDLLLPRKRFRDSISLEDSVEEDIDIDVLEDIEADATTVEVAVDRNVEAGIDVGLGIEVDVRINVKDEVESSDRGTIEVRVDMDAGINIPDEIPLQRIEEIDTAQRLLEAGQLIAN
uniref:Reverse transcriptase domain-containing protein n=1 Tax=Tanacetum cinerariifolium TaxID=118510 RepID=A0A6L2KVK4_TANCI|nr:hypothetical protein [Tanacetum cinerariifolium]